MILALLIASFVFDPMGQPANGPSGQPEAVTTPAPAEPAATAAKQPDPAQLIRDGDFRAFEQWLEKTDNETLAKFVVTTGEEREHGASLLGLAAVHDQFMVAKMLLDRGIPVDQKTRNYTPLEIAAAGNNAATLDLFIRRGADIHAKTQSGGTALHAAAHRGAVDTTAALLDHGAKPDATNAMGQTPVMVAACAGNRSASVVVEMLLAARKDNPEVDENGRTLLHLACFGANPGTIRAVLATKPNLEVEDKEGHRPLQEAAWSFPNARVKLRIIELLVQAGADLNASTSRETPPLFIVTHYSQSSDTLVDGLIKLGASVITKHGDETVVEHAIRSRASAKAVRRLIEAGAAPVADLTGFEETDLLGNSYADAMKPAAAK